MRALIVMGLSLGLLVALLRNRVRIGKSMVISAFVLALFLQVTPGRLWQQIVFEWNNKPLMQTTGYLFISLSALLLLVKVIGALMQEVGISRRLVPAMYGLFRSRRLALAIIPVMMGMLPTPGGIMLSAPMVRDLGDNIGVERSRLAAINFFFRHQWEPVWPLFPAVPLVQGIFGVSAFAVISHNIVITLFGFVGGAVFLLLIGIPPRNKAAVSHRGLSHNLYCFAHAFWPIMLTAILYAGLNIPPAVGILIAIFGLLLLHRLPLGRWPAVFKAAKEPDLVLLVFAALFFKLNLQAAGAISGIVDFLTDANVSPYFVIFALPFLVGYLTGVTMPSVAITFPFLTSFIGTGAAAKMGLETLAFSGLLCGLFTTPVHLCLPLSAGYFETPLSKIIAKLLLPVMLIAAAGVTMALFSG